MKRRTKLIISTMTAVVLLGFVFVSCAEEPPPPLRVGIVVWPGSESLYLARDLGYYDNTPIRLLDYPSDPEMMSSYRNGDLEASTITLDEAWSLAETAPDIRVVIIQDISNGGDAIVAKPEIKKLQDLKGRRVGVESTALGEFELSRALEQVGMLPKDVQVVSLLVSEHERAFRRGSIDAVVTYEPTVSKLRAIGGNLLFDSKQIPGEVLDIVAMRENVLSKQPDAAKAMVIGWFRALDYLQNYPQDAARRIAPHVGMTPEQFLKSLGGIRIPDVQENREILGKTDIASVKAVKRLAKYLVDRDLLKKPTDPLSVFDTRLVQEVKASTFENN